MRHLLRHLLPIAALLSIAPAGAEAIRLLNVSFDATREMYQEINQAFSAEQRQVGRDVVVRQSHGGSGKQARSVIDGLDADLVSLALAYDIDAIASAGMLSADWQRKLPQSSAPFASTMVFVVRAGNPHQIKDWGDLIKPGLVVVTPNPKTSGGARWIFLAAWAYAMHSSKGDQEAAERFMTRLYAQAPVLDTGTRGSTVTFAQREIGDVLLGWESDALSLALELVPGKVEIVVPSESIFAQLPVASVDRVVRARGTESVARAYLEFLFSPTAQRIAAKHHFRPTALPADEAVGAAFSKLSFVTIDDPLFGGWQNAQRKFFADGAIFDQILERGR